MGIDYNHEVLIPKLRHRIEELEDKYVAALEACRAVMEWADSGYGNDYSFVLNCRRVVEKKDDGKEQN